MRDRHGQSRNAQDQAHGHVVPEGGTSLQAELSGSVVGPGLLYANLPANGCK